MLLKNPDSCLFQRQANYPPPFEDLGSDQPVKEWVCVPLINRGKIIGKLSADKKYSQHPITEDEINLIKLFAYQVSTAMHNTRSFDRAKQRATQLEKLRQTMLNTSSSLDRETILGTIIEQGVDLLKAKNGGIYTYDEKNQELTLIAHHKRKNDIGTVLKLGEGLAGKLVKSKKPYRTTKNYYKWSGRSKQFSNNEYSSGSVISMKLQWQNQVIGVLFIGDHVGRQFTGEDRELLRMLCEHAAISLRKLGRLEKMSRAITDITSGFGDTDLDSHLDLIVTRAKDILEAEYSCILLVKRPGFLSLEASSGHTAGGSQKGEEFAIRDAPKSGLTGYIAANGKLFNAHGEKLTRHPAVRGEQPAHLSSGKCYSLLAIPLKMEIDHREETIGLLRVDNKKGRDGCALPSITFTEEDEWILNIFADAVVGTIRNVQLVRSLREREDNLSRLINSSPNGIALVDRKGKLAVLNKKARQVLGYESDHVDDVDVSTFFSKPKNLYRISRALQKSNGGQITNHVTLAKGKQGIEIPIRLSATWLYNSKGKKIGSAGYFEDLRPVKQMEDRLQLLLKAGDTVARAESLNDGLNSLAEMLVSLLSHTFCHIMLMDEKGQSLEIMAAYTIQRSTPLSWRSGVNMRNLCRPSVTFSIEQLPAHPFTLE